MTIEEKKYFINKIKSYMIEFSEKQEECSYLSFTQEPEMREYFTGYLNSFIVGTKLKLKITARYDDDLYNFKANGICLSLDNTYFGIEIEKKINIQNLTNETIPKLYKEFKNKMKNKFKKEKRDLTKMIKQLG